MKVGKSCPQSFHIFGKSFSGDTGIGIGIAKPAVFVKAATSALASRPFTKSDANSPPEGYSAKKRLLRARGISGIQSCDWTRATFLRLPTVPVAGAAC
jgi:hypothetical protein